MSIWRQTLIPVWRDLSGRTCQQALVTVMNTAPSFGGVMAVVDAMAAISVAGVAAVKLSGVEVVNEAPAGGLYASVSDKAVFLLKSSVGSTGRLSCPAPSGDIFLGSTDRVDMGNALVLTLLAAVFANLSDSNGNPWVLCTQAYRDKTRRGLPLFPET